MQVRDPAGSIASETVAVTVLVPPTGARPTNSSQLVCDATRAPRLGRSIPTATPSPPLDADTLAKQLEVPVCDDPRGVARRRRRAELWVACHDDDRVRVLDANGTPLASLPTGYGSAPVGIAASPDGATVYVTLEGAGALLRFNAATLQQTGRLDARTDAARRRGERQRRARAGDALPLAARSRRGLGRQRDDLHADAHARSSRSSATTTNRDSTASGRGVANYLAGIAIAPDGRSAWVASNKPNSERGLLVGPDLDQDNTVRNVVVADRPRPATRSARAIDIDNSDSASAVAFSPLGDYLLVTLQGNNEMVVLDALAVDARRPASAASSPASAPAWRRRASAPTRRPTAPSSTTSCRAASPCSRPTTLFRAAALSVAGAAACRRSATELLPRRRAARQADLLQRRRPAHERRRAT